MNPKTFVKTIPLNPPVRGLAYDPDNCPHSSYVVLAGRKVCNSGCGADLGPA